MTNTLGWMKLKNKGEKTNAKSANQLLLSSLDTIGAYM